MKTHSSRRLESVIITVGNMVAGSHGAEAVAQSWYKHQVCAERYLTGNTMDVRNFKAHPQRNTSSNEVIPPNPSQSVPLTEDHTVKHMRLQGCSHPSHHRWSTLWGLCDTQGLTQELLWDNKLTFSLFSMAHLSRFLIEISREKV